MTTSISPHSLAYGLFAYPCSGSEGGSHSKTSPDAGLQAVVRSAGVALAVLFALLLSGCSMSARDHRCVRDDIVENIASSWGMGFFVLPVLAPYAFAVCSGTDELAEAAPPPLTGSHHVLKDPGDRVSEAAGADAGNADSVRIEFDGPIELGRTIPISAIAHVERVKLGGAARNVELALDPRSVAAIGAEKTPLGDPSGFTFLVHLAVNGEDGDRLSLDPADGWTFAGIVSDLWVDEWEAPHEFAVFESGGVRIGVDTRVAIVSGDGPTGSPTMAAGRDAHAEPAH